MIIDVHNHYYPPEFIAAIKKGPSKYTVEDRRDGNPVLCLSRRQELRRALVIATLPIARR